jgi:hypothetical protein
MVVVKDFAAINVPSSAMGCMKLLQVSINYVLSFI